MIPCNLILRNEWVSALPLLFKWNMLSCTISKSTFPKLSICTVHPLLSTRQCYMFITFQDFGFSVIYLRYLTLAQELILFMTETKNMQLSCEWRLNWWNFPWGHRYRGREMKRPSFKRNDFIWRISLKQCEKLWRKYYRKLSNLGFLVWFIFPSRLGWHSSCPFPFQNHWRPYHLITTLPFGTQTFNLLTLNAP